MDQRLDPYSATEAAANLMLYNYRLLGSWPLAVTAYNHGPGGLRRAQDELGTSNIAVIVKRYQGATFGFASRNFYVAFLAALEVDRNAEKYFGPLTHLPETQSTVVTLPDYVAIDALARAFKADLGALRVLNPALRPPIWNKTRLVPRGYELRIPGSPPSADISAAWARLAPAERFVAQRNDGAHRARRGETLASIAAVSGVSLNRLLAANGLSKPRDLARGETVRIPMPAIACRKLRRRRGRRAAAVRPQHRPPHRRPRRSRRRRNPGRARCGCPCGCTPAAAQGARLGAAGRKYRLAAGRCAFRQRRHHGLQRRRRQHRGGTSGGNSRPSSPIGPKSVPHRCACSTGCIKMPW